MSRWKVVFAVLVFFAALSSVGWFVESRQDVVHTSLWDGSVSQVNVWLKRNWLDLRLRSSIEWGRVEKTADGDFLVPCTFRTTVNERPTTTEALFTFDARGRYVDVNSVHRPSEI